MENYYNIICEMEYRLLYTFWIRLRNIFQFINAWSICLVTNYQNVFFYLVKIWFETKSGDSIDIIYNVNSMKLNINNMQALKE